MRNRRTVNIQKPALVIPLVIVSIFALSLAATHTVPKNQSTVGVAISGQSLVVPDTDPLPTPIRDTFITASGSDSLVLSGTNYDWGQLVLRIGGFPETEANITLMARWMRQENGPPDWWNRNNPLNNGLGSGGGSGLGSYPDLVTAAAYAAKNINRPIFASIANALRQDTSADAKAPGIWVSPWATSHYANGAHWSTRTVERITAPASAWGNITIPSNISAWDNPAS